MGLPDPKQFNFRLLLQRFQKKYGDEITRELLSQFLTDGIIKGEPIREKYQRGGGFVRSWGETRREPVYYVDGPVIDYIVPLDEVLRFEAENPPLPAAPETTISKAEANEMSADETPAAFVTRRRKQGAVDKEIGWELKRQGLSKEMIGRAFYPDTMYHSTNYTKKADKILGLKK